MPGPLDRLRVWLTRTPPQPPQPCVTPAQTPPPGLADIEALLAFLPRLYPGGVAINPFKDAPAEQWPVYVEAVDAFFQAAGQECWIDYRYGDANPGDMLEHPEQIAQASVAQIKSLLTWCVRGERFCYGHHGAVIQNGAVLAILQRLQVIRDSLDHQAPHPRNRP